MSTDLDFDYYKTTTTLKFFFLQKKKLQEGEISFLFRNFIIYNN